MVVPNIVARGTVFSGFSTFSAGMVATSIPKNANKVSAATAENAPILLLSEILKAGKFSTSKKKNPSKMITTKGSNLNCRKGPGTDHEIVGKFPKDAIVNLVKKYNATWHVVRTEEVEGFCHTDYLAEVQNT